MPDEVPRPAPVVAQAGPSRPTDVLDLYFEFATALPALMKGGEPRSFPLFMAGVAYLQRAHARASLRSAASTGVAMSGGREAQEWHRTQSTIAGW